MYADISKPPAPLPQAKPQTVTEGITLLSPLSRLGQGPGLVILHPDSDKHLEIIDGVPSALIKWAEEGYAVVEVQTKALRGDAGEVLKNALQALRSCEGFVKDSKVGLIGKFPYFICFWIYLITWQHMILNCGTNLLLLFPTAT
jgi:carboxymethylenebutenolidase